MGHFGTHTGQLAQSFDGVWYVAVVFIFQNFCCIFNVFYFGLKFKPFCVISMYVCGNVRKLPSKILQDKLVHPTFHPSCLKYFQHYSHVLLDESWQHALLDLSSDCLALTKGALDIFESKTGYMKNKFLN